MNRQGVRALKLTSFPLVALMRLVGHSRYTCGAVITAWDVRSTSYDMTAVLTRASFRPAARLHLSLSCVCTAYSQRARLFRSTTSALADRGSASLSADFLDCSSPPTSTSFVSSPDFMPSSPLSSRSFDLVVAATQRGGIGHRGDLPWGRALKGDLIRFKQLTTSISPPSSPTTDDSSSLFSSPSPASSAIHNAVVMGRKTWDSIPTHLRPLSGRLNVIVTVHEAERIRAETNQHDNVLIASSLSHALTSLSSPRYNAVISNVFLIGGASLIREALLSPSLHHIHLTQVLKDIECDTFIPAIAASDSLQLDIVGDVTVEGGIPYQFLTFRRTTPSPSSSRASSSSCNPEEQQYLSLVERIISTGSRKGDRTGVGTLSLFGEVLRFDLSRSFPLLTTKRVFFRGVVEELLWLIRGCTDSKELAKRKVHIWDSNGSRAFLDKLGFTEREEGDLGPVYGHQWRHFGAQYVDCHTDYTGQGVDQLQAIIQTLRSNPNDRRLLMSAWNPTDLPKMALPPCHVLTQFYVSADGRLSCAMHQRSCDMGLGVPFNVASYSLLTVMVAHVCNLQLGEFVHVLGDAHVYLNHVEALKLQCQREPRGFPQLRVKRNVSDIDSFTADDFELSGYEPYDNIKMEMAV